MEPTEQEKRDMIRQALMDKYQTATSDTSALDDAKSSARNTDLIAGIGNALETAARAKGASVGGARNDGSFYKGLQDSAQQDVKLAQIAHDSGIRNSLQAIDMNRGMEGDRRNDIQDTRNTNDYNAAQAKIKAENDPSSAESKLAQDLFSQLNPGKPVPEGLTSARFKEFSPMYKQTFEQAAKNRELSQGDRKLDIEEGKANAAKLPSRSDSMALTKQYMDHPTTKNTNTINEAYGKLAAISKDAEAMKTGAGDISLVFSYMKMLDPGSTVREGEQATARNSGGVGESVSNMYNAILKGQTLSPTQRQEFVETAAKIKGAQDAEQQKIRAQYADQAIRYQLDPNQVLGAAPQSPEDVKAAKAARVQELLRKQQAGQ